MRPTGRRWDWVVGSPPADGDGLRQAELDVRRVAEERAGDRRGRQRVHDEASRHEGERAISEPRPPGAAAAEDVRGPWASHAGSGPSSETPTRSQEPRRRDAVDHGDGASVPPLPLPRLRSGRSSPGRRAMATPPSSTKYPGRGNSWAVDPALRRWRQPGQKTARRASSADSSPVTFGVCSGSSAAVDQPAEGSGG